MAAGLRLFVSDKKLLLIDYTVDGRRYFNHYIAGQPAFDKTVMLRWVEEIKKREREVTDAALIQV